MADITIPRSEYPRPQMVRPDWINLNGTWQFEIDDADTGRERGLPEAKALGSQILVPFCPESALSGVGHLDFMNAVWYRRTFTLPQGWNQNVLLHFGAVDYDTEAWVNGQSVGTHRGGYSSFTFDITAALKAGENTLVVCARDNTRSGLQPTGKQSHRYASYACLYTRTTGIWQTVWLESVPKLYIQRLLLTPDAAGGALHVEARLSGHGGGHELAVSASFEGAPMGSASVAVDGRTARLTLPLSEKHLWEPGAPRLYDLRVELIKSGEATDAVDSYFGLRSVSFDDRKIYLNGKPVFQRLVLDQGFYPDGIYTAPTDEALRRDIELGLEMGFNGARLHQKMFEERYLYWADKLGYLVWGEHANWGLDLSNPNGLERFLPEWMETLQRDYSHPALVGWCPFNETGDARTIQDNAILATVYAATKAFDSTRPVIDTSGYLHVITDIYDVHDYDQNPETFAARYEGLHNGDAYVNYPTRESYEGQPYFVSEYGGIWWNPSQSDDVSWGYGDRPKSHEEFYDRYEKLTMALLNHPRMCAFCYTQLTDVELEVNGLYTYERAPKHDAARIRAVNIRKAAIEE